MKGFRFAALLLRIGSSMIFAAGLFLNTMFNKLFFGVANGLLDLVILLLLIPFTTKAVQAYE